MLFSVVPRSVNKKFTSASQSVRICAPAPLLDRSIFENPAAPWFPLVAVPQQQQPPNDCAVRLVQCPPRAILAESQNDNEMSCEILISISFGDNFPLREPDYLSKECKIRAILEAKFNDEVLLSDPIEIDSPHPELATELGFRVNKKDFHQFRTERKSIKLQCYVDYSSQIERHFIGYVVLHLRDAQDYTTDPKYRWVVLLNPKYKGAATKRPQLYLSLMVNKLHGENGLIESVDGSTMDGSSCGPTADLSSSQFTRSIRKDPRHAMTDSVVSFDFATNLIVEITSPYVYIWNKELCDREDCGQIFTIHIHMNRPSHLINLFNEQSSIPSVSESQYFFRYVLFGRQIKTALFSDLEQCTDFQLHKHSVNIKTLDKGTLQEYFESYPTIEIQFCSSHNELIGFVTINLLKLFQQNNAFIYGNFVVVPEEESVYVKDPFPVINLRLFLLNKNLTPNEQPTTTTYLERPIDYINHYYIAIDLRTIKLSTENIDSCQILFQPFYLQFSYAFFGATEPIKTYPSIRFLVDKPDQEITIPHGFCGFNLATTFEKLCYTFNNLPLIIQLILEQDNTLLGTSQVDLKCLLEKRDSQTVADDNFVNTVTHVYDELNDQICQIQVIMFVQELFDSATTADEPMTSSRPAGYHHFTRSIDLGHHPKSLSPATSDSSKSVQSANSGSGGLERQKTFDKRPGKPKAAATTNKNSTVSLKHKLLEKEIQLEALMEKLNEREKILFEQERLFDRKQKELEKKLSNSDMDVNAVRLDLEHKINQLQSRICAIEQEKYKFQEKNYQLERKMKEKNLKIQELEAKIFELTQMNKRKPDSTGTAAAAMAASSNIPRKIVITRENTKITATGCEDTGNSKAAGPPPTRSKSVARPAAVASMTSSSVSK